MTGNSQGNALITRYLLGQASVEECAQIEDQYLKDDDLFEEMVSVENDLIDAYVRGQLGGLEQRQFEASFLSTPERRERVEFAKFLIAAGKTESERYQSRMFVPRLALGARFAVAAALLLAVAGLTWLVVANRQLHHELDKARTAETAAQEQAQALHRQIADLQARAVSGQNLDITHLPPGSTILSLTLAPGLVRSHNQHQNTLRLTPGISQVHLLLQQDHDEYSSYDAILETAEGRRVWRGSATREGAKVVIVQISPNALKRDDYVLRLFASTSTGRPTEVGTYSFRILQQ